MQRAPFHLAWETNPIFKREMRARWRRLPTVALLFAYAALLAFAMSWLYDERFSSGIGDPRQYLGALGHQLFVALATLQTGLWILIAPALTATTIAAERERGLLEALQLARISAYRIVAGKLLSILSFIALLLLVPLPIIAVCFLMGGVSPGEFGQALSLQVVTALQGAILGLFFSARSRRPGAALRNVFLFVAVWSGAGFAAFQTQRNGWYYADDLGLIWLRLLFFLGLSNPVAATLAVLEPVSNRFSWPELTWVATPPTAVVPIPFVPPGRVANTVPAITSVPLDPTLVWIACLGLQAAFCLLCLWLTTRAVHRPLAEPYWIERRHWIERLKKRWQERATSDPLKQRARRALLWEIPLSSRIRFANPIVQREARGKFRLRRAPLWRWLLCAVMVLPFVWIYLSALANALENPWQRLQSWNQLISLALAAVLLATTIMTAGAFTRERESSTWEALHLSLLSPLEILAGKFAPPLLACFCYSLPLWPVLWYCVDWMGGASLHTDSKGIPLERAFVIVCILAATAWCSTAVGMLISWLSRSTAAAIGWTLAVYLLLMVFLPGLLMTGLGPAGRDDVATGFYAWHPVLAVDLLARRSPDFYDYDGYYGYSGYYGYGGEIAREALQRYNGAVLLASLCPVVLLLIGGALLGLIWSFMQQQFRDEA